MKKTFIVLVVILVVLGVGGYVGYAEMMNVVGAKMMDQVADNLSAEDIKQLKADPAIEAFLNDSSESLSELPVKTKKEAAKLITDNFSIKEIIGLALKAKGGLTSEEKTEIKNQLESRLTTDEMNALKATAAKELQK